MTVVNPIPHVCAERACNWSPFRGNEAASVSAGDATLALPGASLPYEADCWQSPETASGRVRLPSLRSGKVGWTRPNTPVTRASFLPGLLSAHSLLVFLRFSAPAATGPAGFD